MSINALLDDLLNGRDLTEADAEAIGYALTADDMAPALAGALLAAMRAKGETKQEVRGLAKALQKRAVRVHIDRDGPPLVDTAGTGGDGSHSLNLSTASALVAAAAGCRVVKHGNRAVSSKSGSADVLKACGIALADSPESATKQLETTGFTFLLAPAFHPTVKNVGAVRRAMGVRTVFNLLGPLLNPAGPDAQIIGVATESIGDLMAAAAAGLDVPHVFVVHGAEGWDEPTPVGPFMVWRVSDGKVTREVRDPNDLGIARCRPDELRGDDPVHNAARLMAVLRNEEQGAHRDAVVLGAALALEVARVQTDPRLALEQAKAAIDQGKAAAVLDALQTHGRASATASSVGTKSNGTNPVAARHGALSAFVADSERRARALPPAAELRRQLSDLPPVRELAVDGFGVIAEVKFRAPSVTGPLGRPSPEEAVRQAKAYERGNATAISVLTCPEGFDGHIDHMRAVAKAVPLPVMRKDFLVDPNQIFEARLAGASGVLLIARILDDLPAMLQAAGEAGLFSLVEVFDEDDISKLPSNLVSDGPVLLGVNSRCLDTLQVKPQRHKDLRTRLPKGFLTVAESGLTGAEDAATAARNGYELVLVGSALMKGGEPAEAVRAMLEAGKTAGVTPCT